MVCVIVYLKAEAWNQTLANKVTQFWKINAVFLLFCGGVFLLLVLFDFFWVVVGEVSWSTVSILQKACHNLQCHLVSNQKVTTRYCLLSQTIF